MRFTALTCLFVITFQFYTSAQIITGRIVDKRTIPIANATVSITLKTKTITSNAEGLFSINATAVRSPSTVKSINAPVFFNGSTITFTNTSPANIKIELFDMTGRRCGPAFYRLFETGSFSIPVSALMSQKSAGGLYIIRFTNGHTVTTHPFSPVCTFGSGERTVQQSRSVLAKRLVVSDTLKVTKEAYKPVAIPFDSDAPKEFGDIKLELVNDPDTAIEKKVDSLIALMTNDEKIAQTAEVLVDVISTADLTAKMYGSVFNGGGCPFPSLGNTKEIWAQELDKMHDAAKQSRLGIPILYGIDAVHGVATIEGATVFPHNIGMGCTGDTALVAKMATITAKECRAVGINLNFGPAISVVRNEKWGRSYEGYGETPEINALMAAAYVRGLQGNGDMSRPDAVAACAKHFVGDGGTTDGINGGVTSLTEATIRAVHLPPYAAAVKERVSSIMPSYNAWMRGGQEYRCTNDKFTLTDMLKTGLDWDGFCLSDWNAIPSALASTNQEALYFDNNVSAAINAGIDMAMVAKPYGLGADQQLYITEYTSTFSRTLGAQTIQQSRLDDAVRRILRIKYRLNLFDNVKSNADLRSEFGSAAHRAIARECVQKSLVLLKNQNTALPLKKTEKIAVVGPWANMLGPQCGGWTITWQGIMENSGIAGTTILEGIKQVGGESNIVFLENGDNISDVDKIVLVVGECPYSEGTGDHGHKNSVQDGSCVGCYAYKDETMSINLADCPHASLIEKCKQAGKPVIIVLISGRPLIITDALENKCDAFVAAWLPGSEGAGVADVLYGDKPFTGKLKHTWPRTFEQIPINSGTAYTEEQKGTGGTPLFNYDHGLTY